MHKWGTVNLRGFVGTFGACVVLFCFFGFHYVAEAATIRDFRDTISDSGPNEYSNHTVEFKTTVEIPAGGFILFTPDDGDFVIPATDIDHENVEIAINTSSSYVTRVSTSTQSATEDGISITSGSSGSVLITLNSADSIPANARVRVKIGTHTELSTTTDVGIVNPPTTGSYRYYITAGTGSDASTVSGLIAIVDKVSVGPIDTRETDPPIRFNGAPSGTISGTTQAVVISVETDEFSRCRYDIASGTPYFSMTNEFTTTGFKTIHPKTISVATSTSYQFFVRCIDDEGNANIDDYVISFTVPEYPEGTPGGSGEGEGGGTGGGSGTGSTGGGSGSSGGDGGGGSTSSGSGGGGGGGGGSGSSSEGDNGSGGFEGTIQPYQSGDGLVIINGFASPRSTVYVLVDGSIAKSVTSNSDGSFSVEVDQIARGVYTFGVYAVDRDKTKSSTFSTTFSVTGARGSTLSNVNIMPSIKVNPNPVQPGSPLTVSGYTIPNALVTIENQSDKSSVGLKSYTATSDSSGKWSTTIDTTGLKSGTYKVRAKAKQETGDMVSTNFSDYTYYGVGAAAAVPRSSDLNRDGKVNLIDFSILLFWWNSNGGNSNPPADINGDGKVNLTDFSILIFNWTG